MNKFVDTVVTKVATSQKAFCRFITANDVGSTGSHQAGFFIAKSGASLLFDELGEKGANKEKVVKIKWQDDFTTDSRFVYYGRGSRNEYRITRFGRNFPFLTEENVGNLLVLAKVDEDDYLGFVLAHDEDIETFFSCFNLSSGTTNRLIELHGNTFPKQKLQSLFEKVLAQCPNLPETRKMGSLARDCYNQAYAISEKEIVETPDQILMSWIDAEYSLFRNFEEKLYKPIYSQPFDNCQVLIDFANQILNRRKSRAGKSLEHHLAAIFTWAKLKFEEQVITEDNKKPDFIFPDGISYHNLLFPADKLVFLGAKTTCKDRWRQVLNEADRIERKYLFTLQQGISKNQLREMKHEHLTLVVPAQYKSSFAKEYQDEILSLHSFISMVREKQK